jgi:glutathione-regulated potassium-efflux system ancillary protein KefC
VADPAATLHFAEIGVVLMLFVIGLELDPRHLWKMRRGVFGGGALQLAACAAPLGTAAWLFGLSWQAALVVGLALGLSSTAVSMQTMAERGLLSSPAGKTSFSILLFQDMAAIPLLALVPLLAARTEVAEAGDGSALLASAKVLGAVALVVVIGRFLTRPVLRILASTGLREVFTAFALLLVLGIALLMDTAGVSMGLGAFLAGVLLAGSEYRHALESDIEPFKGLLMGLFFIAVGMSIDFGLVATRPLEVVSLVLGYQVLKGLVLGLLGPRLGVDGRQRWLVAALLAQGGEFAFVVFGVARGARLLPGDWDALLTLAVALSMALTPVALFLATRVSSDPAGSAREPDVIEDEHAPVIIAGFGRFGQIVGRLLFASGIRATVLDFDPSQIELLKRFDFRVYYGDATRLDLLHAAGAARAKLLVVALDDPAASVRLVELAREEFPRLRIVARARNVGHWYELRARGVEDVERETFEAALAAGRRSLQLLGVGAHDAHERAAAFRRHNVTLLEELLPHWQDEERRTHLARSGREQLERQMERERAERASSDARDWHEHTSASKATEESS